MISLNQEQKKAVYYKNGPLLIVAGPGTGKTAVITSRIINLVSKKKINPEEVLALTFTNKAANEMEERVYSSMNYQYLDLWIHTFHSFCDRILRENALEIGLSPDFKVIDGVGSWIIIKQNIDKLNLNYYKPLGSSNKFISAIISHFSKLKDQLIEPQQYLELAKKLKKQEKDKIKEISNAYSIYQDILLKNNCLDYGDLINYTLKLFDKRPLIIKKYREKFKHVLIDEFQDTNYGQYKLIKKLAIKHRNITICADENQAIYQWRGASSKNISRFKKDFKEYKEVFLTKNYRSRQNILDLSHKFIKLSDSKNTKKLIANKKGRGLIQHLHFNSVENELNGIIEKIIEISKTKDINFNDFAILARTNNDANLMALFCERFNLPYFFVSLKGLYQKPIIIDIISYLNLLNNYYEDASVYRVLNFPFLKISPQEISTITRFSHKKFKSVYSCLKQVSLIPEISNNSKKTINNLLKMIDDHHQLSSRKNVSQVFISFLQDSGYLKYLTKNGTKNDIDYINQFYDRILKFEQTSLNLNLNNFIQEINFEIESGELGKIEINLDNKINAVPIMTIHTAKGLEFKYVFIINLVDRKFPSDQKKELIEMPEKINIFDKHFHLEEERKLFYVAMTRAKDGLFFTSAKNYGGFKNKKISRFLFELGYSFNVNVELNNNINEKKLFKKTIKINNIPDHFSFTQIMAFRNCPLQYKFCHILKIPMKSKPVFVFGKTLHNTLYDFIKSYSQEKVNLKDLNEVYKNNWSNEWYEDKKQRNDYYKLGQSIIKKFYNNLNKEKPKILFIDKKPALEKSFVIKINNELIKGKIDRIDKIKNGVEIIDYKTGTPKEKIKKDEKDQLLIYCIAVQDLFKLKPIKLSYYYLNSGQKISFTPKDKDIFEIKNRISETIKEIKKSDFKATPGWHCKYCDFKNICEDKY